VDLESADSERADVIRTGEAMHSGKDDVNIEPFAWKPEKRSVMVGSAGGREHREIQPLLRRKSARLLENSSFLRRKAAETSSA